MKSGDLKDFAVGVAIVCAGLLAYDLFVKRMASKFLPMAS